MNPTAESNNSGAEAAGTEPKVSEQLFASLLRELRKLETVDDSRAELVRRDPPQIMSVFEAAWYLNCSEKTIRTDIDARRLSCVRLGGRVLLRLVDLHADLDRMAVRAAA
jgi:excisionase family DNA binding protein